RPDEVPGGEPIDRRILDGDRPAARPLKAPGQEARKVPLWGGGTGSDRVRIPQGQISNGLHGSLTNVGEHGACLTRLGRGGRSHSESGQAQPPVSNRMDQLRESTGV